MGLDILGKICSAATPSRREPRVVERWVETVTYVDDVRPSSSRVQNGIGVVVALGLGSLLAAINGDPGIPRHDPNFFGEDTVASKLWDGVNTPLVAPLREKPAKQEPVQVQSESHDFRANTNKSARRAWLREQLQQEEVGRGKQ